MLTRQCSGRHTASSAWCDSSETTTFSSGPTRRSIPKAVLISVPPRFPMSRTRHRTRLRELRFSKATRARFSGSSPDLLVIVQVRVTRRRSTPRGSPSPTSTFAYLRTGVSLPRPARRRSPDDSCSAVGEANGARSTVNMRIRTADRAGGRSIRHRSSTSSDRRQPYRHLGLGRRLPFPAAHLQEPMWDLARPARRTRRPHR